MVDRIVGCAHMLPHRWAQPTKTAPLFLDDQLADKGRRWWAVDTGDIGNPSRFKASCLHSRSLS